MSFLGKLAAVFGRRTEPLSEAEFTKHYLDALQRHMPEVQFALEGDLTIAGPEGQRHFLDNAYRAYRLDPPSLDSTVEQYIAATKQLYAQRPPLRRECVVAMVKPADFYADMPEAADRSVWERYNDDLIVAYMQDSEYTLASIGVDDLKALEISRESLRELALSNMARLLPKIEVTEVDGIRYVIAGGTLEASLILMNGIWTTENFPVDGSIVVAIPCRDLLAVTGSDNADAIERLRAFAQKWYDEGDHPITPNIFRLSGDSFTTF